MQDPLLLNRIEKIILEGRDIFIIDYCDCKENQMILLIQSLRQQILVYNKPVNLVSVFNDKSYATAAFMHEIRAAAREASHLLEKEAVVGLSNTKRMILKGYNFFFRKSVQAFNTREEALQHILSDTYNSRVE